MPDSSFVRSRVTFLLLYSAAVIYTLVFASNGAGFLKCPFRALTGYSCFGCGMTRSWTHALTGDLAQSLHFHLFGALALAIVTAAALLTLMELVARKPLVRPDLRKRAENIFWGSALVALVVFGLTRFGLEVAGILTPV